VLAALEALPALGAVRRREFVAPPERDRREFAGVAAAALALPPTEDRALALLARPLLLAPLRVVSFILLLRSASKPDSCRSSPLLTSSSSEAAAAVLLRRDEAAMELLRLLLGTLDSIVSLRLEARLERGSLVELLRMVVSIALSLEVSVPSGERPTDCRDWLRGEYTELALDWFLLRLRPLASEQRSETDNNTRLTRIV
jgi:hypothetical protein